MMNETGSILAQSGADTPGRRVAYGLIGLVGVLGNLVVLLVFTLSSTRSSISSVIPRTPRRLVLHQSSVDCLWSLSLVCMQWVPPPSSTPSPVYCKLWASQYVFWILAEVSTLNLAALSLERYVALCHGFWHLSHLTKASWWKFLLFFTLLWVLSVVTQIHVVKEHVVGTTNVCVMVKDSHDVRVIVGIVNFLFKFLAPVVVMTVAYAAMIRALRSRTPRATNGVFRSTNNNSQSNLDGRSMSVAGVAGEGGAGEGAPPGGRSLLRVTSTVGVKQRARRNLIVTLWLVDVFFILCYAPNQITYFLHNLNLWDDLGGLWHEISIAILFLNCCLNPFIYCFKLRVFKRQLKACLRRVFCSACNRTSSSSDSADRGCHFHLGQRRVSRHDSVETSDRAAACRHYYPGDIMTADSSSPRRPRWFSIRWRRCRAPSNSRDFHSCPEIIPHDGAPTSGRPSVQDAASSPPPDLRQLRADVRALSRSMKGIERSLNQLLRLLRSNYPDPLSDISDDMPPLPSATLHRYITSRPSRQRSDRGTEGREFYSTC